ncbi:PH domain-containing protein [Citricoccus sp. CH26A]|uniref:PH domain-containing protein n=1 Tax=Citricoccus TaxID=169133 RepID=UPI00351024B4
MAPDPSTAEVPDRAVPGPVRPAGDRPGAVASPAADRRAPAGDGRGLAPIEAAGVEWTAVSPRLVPVRLISKTIGWVVWLAIVSVPLVLRLSGVWEGYPGWLAWLLPAVMLFWAVIDLALVPRRVRALGYSEQDDELLLRSGIISRQITAVPYGRLQYLDVNEGPLQRRFGIRTLTIKTASGSTDASIDGIEPTESDRLREELMARGQARLAGL